MYKALKIMCYGGRLTAVQPKRSRIGQIIGGGTQGHSQSVFKIPEKTGSCYTRALCVMPDAKTSLFFWSLNSFITLCVLHFS
jgi:hypothetical protein